MFRSRVLVFWSVLKVSEMIKTLKWTPILLLKYSILTVVTGDSCRGRFTKVSHQNGFIVFLLKGRQPMKNHEFCLLGQFGGHLCFNPAQQKGLEHSMKLIGCRQEQQCYKLPHKYENLWSLFSDSLEQIWQVSHGERESIYSTPDWHCETDIFFCDLPCLRVIWGIQFGTNPIQFFCVT